MSGWAWLVIALLAIAVIDFHTRFIELIDNRAAAFALLGLGLILLAQQLRHHTRTTAGRHAPHS